jgi:hypothetical protein
MPVTQQSFTVIAKVTTAVFDEKLVNNIQGDSHSKAKVMH